MTEKERAELQRAYDDYVEASMYSGGADSLYGNPHREMEYERELSARRRFVELCEKYGITPDSYKR